MTITPFPIDYLQSGILKHAEVHPCCKEDDIVDYAIYHNGKLTFTITKDIPAGKWVVAMKNADDVIPPEVVRNIGAAIDQNKHQ